MKIKITHYIEGDFLDSYARYDPSADTPYDVRFEKIEKVYEVEESLFNEYEEAYHKLAALVVAINHAIFPD